MEDNHHVSQYELDRFNKPHYFNPVEEIHNTHNGELPGHGRKGEDPKIKGRHASDILGSPYEAELKASTYPENPTKKAEKDVKEAVEQ